METVFLQLINMGITAGWIVLGLLLVRLAIRKAPKWITCLLWSVVGLRLVLPVTPVSRLSLLPSVQPIPVDITNAQIPRVQTGIPTVNLAINPLVDKIGDMSGFIRILAIVWAVGAVAMILYGAVSYMLLHRKVAAAIETESGVYICDYVNSPFVLGVFRPRIYLPSGMDDKCTASVLAHERAHLRRRDHWWKPLGYVLLAVYWFNPLLWLAYILLCRDIESACDEKVIKAMDLQGRKEYSLNLAQCSVHRVRILTCPVAFGEVGVKNRVRAILSYKKPAFWLVTAAAVLCVVASVCFLTAPRPCAHVYVDQITKEPSCTEKGLCMRNCSLCNDRYTQEVDMLDHSYDADKITIEPTCTKEGVRQYTCTGCGHQYTEPVAMLAHTYGAGQVITPADCVQPGLQQMVCTICGDVSETTIGISNEHQFVSEQTKASTCVEQGEITNTCSLCNYVQVTAAPLAEHDYRKLVEVAGNCTNNGVRELICNVCKHQTREFTPPKKDAHFFVEAAVGQMICYYCGESKKTESRSSTANSSVYSNQNSGLPWYADPQPTYTPFPVIKWDLAS